MLLITRADGQSLQIGDITVTVLDVGEEEVLLRVECPEGSTIEPGNVCMQSQWRRD